MVEQLFTEAGQPRKPLPGAPGGPPQRTLISGGRRRDRSLNPIVARVKDRLVALVRGELPAKKFDESEARDEAGRWTSGGGGAQATPDQFEERLHAAAGRVEVRRNGYAAIAKTLGLPQDEVYGQYAAPAAVEETAAAIDKVAADYPALRGSFEHVAFGETGDSGTVAYTERHDTGTVLVVQPEPPVELIRQGVATGWATANTTGLGDVVTHELGHAIGYLAPDGTNGSRLAREYEAAVFPQIPGFPTAWPSGYGRFSYASEPREFFAEGFATHYNGSPWQGPDAEGARARSEEFFRVLPERVRGWKAQKFDESEARDEAGRWTSGGGSGTSYEHLDALDPARAQPAIEQLHRLQQQFPDAPLGTVTGDPKDMMPWTSAATTDPDAEGKVTLGLNPAVWGPGQDWLPGMAHGYADNTPTGIVTHEFGHVVYQQITNMGLTGAADRIVGRPFTGYGRNTEDHSERFAEAFSGTFANGTQFPRADDLRAFMAGHGIMRAEKVEKYNGLDLVAQALRIVQDAYYQAFIVGFQDAYDDTEEEDPEEDDPYADVEVDPNVDVPGIDEDDMDPEDYVIINDAAQQQQGFLTGLAAQIVGGALTGPQLEARMKQYAASINPIYERGFQRGVENQGDITRVRWNAQGDEKECDLCDARDGKTWLESEPYPFPGEGDFGEICEGAANCRCWLTYELAVPGSETFAAAAGADLTKLTAVELQRLREWLRKYSEDEPRDDHGRWTVGGGLSDDVRFAASIWAGTDAYGSGSNAEMRRALMEGKGRLYPEALVLARAVAAGTSAPPLFRGFTIQPSDAYLEHLGGGATRMSQAGLADARQQALAYADLQPGDAVDMNLGSWSTSRDYAVDFSAAGGYPVVFELAGGARGLDLTSWGKERGLDEGEWLTDGEFRVVGTRTEEAGWGDPASGYGSDGTPKASVQRVIVAVRQVRPFEPSEMVGRAMKYSEDEPRDDHGRWTGDGGSWTGEVANHYSSPQGRTEAKHQLLNEHPELRPLAEAAQAWSEKSVDRTAVYQLIQNAARDLLRGKEYENPDPKATGWARTMLTAVDNAPPSDKTLYRGVDYKGDLPKPGDLFHETLASWTGNHELANYFAEGGISHPVVFEVEGAKAVPLTVFGKSGDKLYYTADEYMSDGHYRVDQVLPGQDDMDPTIVKVTQTGTWDLASMHKAFPVVDLLPPRTRALLQPADRAMKYSDDELRDERGRWTAGGSAPSPEQLNQMYGEFVKQRADEWARLPEDWRSLSPKEALARAQAETGTKMDPNLVKVNPDALREALYRLTELHDQFPGVHISDLTAMTPSQAIAANAPPGAIAATTLDNDQIRLKLVEDTWRQPMFLYEGASSPGWNPPGTGSPAGTITHEFGHAIMLAAFQQMRDGDKALANNWTDYSLAYLKGPKQSISGYGATDPREEWAERVRAAYAPGSQSADSWQANVTRDWLRANGFDHSSSKVEKYSEAQLRAPAGTAEGGQWTSEGLLSPAEFEARWPKQTGFNKAERADFARQAGPEMNRALWQLDRLFGQFHIVQYKGKESPPNVRMVWPDSAHTEAFTSGNSVNFSPLFFGPTGELPQDEISETFYATGVNSPYAVATHEFGHWADAALSVGYGSTNEDYQSFRKAALEGLPLSTYARTNDAEKMAEIWAAAFSPDSDNKDASAARALRNVLEKNGLWTPSKVSKYSEDQPRDEAGRWTSGGGGPNHLTEADRMRMRQEHDVALPDKPFGPAGAGWHNDVVDGVVVGQHYGEAKPRNDAMSVGLGEPHDPRYGYQNPTVPLSWGPEQFAGWAKSLTPDEQTALSSWKHDDWRDVNEQLRGRTLLGTPVAPETQVTEQISAMDKALQGQTVPQDITVYRELPLGGALPEDRDLTGYTIHDRGFGSTTTDPNFIAVGHPMTVVQIDVPKGSRGAFIDVPGLFSAPSQHEVLLDRDYRVRITSDKWSADHQYRFLKGVLRG